MLHGHCPAIEDTDAQPAEDHPGHVIPDEISRSTDPQIKFSHGPTLLPTDNLAVDCPG